MKCKIKLTVTPQEAWTALCDIDTRVIYDQPSVLQIGYNCTEPQWKQRLQIVLYVSQRSAASEAMAASLTGLIVRALY